jgi:hypothetical protein
MSGHPVQLVGRGTRLLKSADGDLDLHLRVE